MEFNFDVLTSRVDTDSIRWDYYSKDTIPLWVADMDFPVAPCIQEAISKRVNHGIFGYTHTPNNFNEKISQYLLKQYNWKVDPSWIVIFPNVISGLHSAARQLTRPDESCLIPNPVYQNISKAVTSSKRELIEVPMLLENNRWVLAWNQLDQIIKKNSKLFYLCNPHNPGGTVFNLKELTLLANFIIQNDLIICSDEIHAGLVLDPNSKHIPIASISKDISQRSLTLMSLNKTFNFPGMGLAWAVAENPKIRDSIRADLHSIISEPSILGYTSTISALNDGEPWRLELLKYLRGNLKLVEDAIKHTPRLEINKTEATYLAWIDCKNLNSKNPQSLFLKNGLALSPGDQFGSSQFVRMNYGTPRSYLTKALKILNETAN